MEQAITVAVYPKGQPIVIVQAQLTELAGLVEAAGARVVATLTQAREQTQAGLGRGALQQLVEQTQSTGATLVVFNQQLTPSSLNQVQTAMGDRVRVLDRTQVILDIFARRARSREGRVQVELAQYRYLEPRLKGRVGLTRQGGGIGTRGPGETRLELDRRSIRRRVRDLAHQLARIEQEREGRRRRRARTQLPQIALVGYTNVGKSTLYSLLTHRAQEADDALFVTLDPTVRRMLVAGFGSGLLADTVGFVDRLPHELVAAFRSTLAEVRDADLILEVVSANPTFPVDIGTQRRVIADTLRVLESDRIPRLLVYSQWDRVRAPGIHEWDAAGVRISAVGPFGIDELLKNMAKHLANLYRDERIRISWQSAGVWRIVYAEFTIVERHDSADGAELVLRGSDRSFFLLHQALGSAANAPRVVK